MPYIFFVLVCFRSIGLQCVVMAPKQPKSGLFVGLNKGHIVTRKELAPRPSDRKGVSITVFISFFPYLVLPIRLDWICLKVFIAFLK